MAPPTTPPSAPEARYAPRRRPRWGTLLLIAALHVAALGGLARLLAPDFTTQAIDRAASLVSVTITAPPEPEPAPSPQPEAGTAGDEGQRATPREVSAPPAPLPRLQTAPPAASTGTAETSGAADQGGGTGAGGSGDGTGSGGAGEGQGGSAARPLEMISGRIDNARDYPTPPGGRQVRRGHDVIIELTVGADGRVSACRVTDPSPDPEADAITCRLATERFVFRPRLNAQGEAVVGIYRWRQRWF